MVDETASLLLVVDDHEESRYVTARTLRRAGFHTQEVATGAEALAMAEQRPALILLDVNLPDINGFEVCHRLKTDPATATIPVMHLSASMTASQDRVYGLEGGADGYLVHPVEPEELVATVRALLRLSRAEEETRGAAREWQTTFDAISDGVFLVDKDRRILRCNYAAAGILGRTREELLGISCREAFPDGDLRGLLYQPLLAPSGPEVAADVPVGSRWFHVTLNAAPTDAADGGMVAILSDITERKSAERERDVAYARERRIAETLQRSLLITVPETSYSGLRVATRYAAAWEESSLGGDFFDTFTLPDGRIALVIGDASGKGLEAAVHTAEVKFALRAILHLHPFPAKALAELNDFLYHTYAARDAGDASLVALSLVIIDGRTGIAMIAAAGAEPPLILRDSGEDQQIVGGGLPLGADLDSRYEETAVTLGTRDTLLLATDGITEARCGRVFLGYEGMAEMARQANAGPKGIVPPATSMALSQASSSGLSAAPTLDEMAEAILRGSQAFAGGKLQDDACLLVARYVGP